MTVRKLLVDIDSRELSEWQAFSILEPFGTEIDFYGPAIIASTIANVNRKKGRSTIKPEKFMPEFGKGIGEIPIVQSPDEIKGMMMALVKSTDPNRRKRKPKLRKDRKKNNKEKGD